MQGPEELKDNRAGAAGDGERGISGVGLEMVAGISNMSYTRAVFDVRGCRACVCVSAEAYLSLYEP